MISSFDFAKEAEIKFKKVNFTRRIGLNEKKLLDEIESQIGRPLERQFGIRTEMGQFYTDGYDPIKNVVYEVDEPHHKLQQVEDFIREQAIKNKNPVFYSKCQRSNL